MSGGNPLRRLRKLWLVEDLIKRHLWLPPVFGLEPLVSLTQLPAPGVLFDLAVPLVAVALPQMPHEFVEFLPRQTRDGSLDLLNCRHARNLSHTRPPFQAVDCNSTVPT
jgi:hypothetical protein